MELSMNCNSIKFYWFILLIFFFNNISFAQSNTDSNSDSAVVSVEKDSSDMFLEDVEDTTVTKTLFDENNDSILKWKQSREFAYMAYLDSLLRKKTDLKPDTINIDENTGKKRAGRISISQDDRGTFLNSLPLKIFFWAIAIFFICFIIYKLFLTNGLFAKKTVKIVDEANNENPESLNEYSEYNLLIHEAELKKDFNLAIRYLYLQMLKRLTDNELINFSPDKTNDKYVYELSGKNYQQQFARLTLNYEYVWYGKFLIDANKYHQVKEEFVSFNKKV
jgi:hypothetical protein